MMGGRRVEQALCSASSHWNATCRRIICCRAIDRFVDLSEMRRDLAPFYSTTGRPSIDPELLIRMLLVGYCYGLRSERRLCEEVHLNLAYRWFCRLGLDGDVPDHSTFSKNRHGRFRESDLLRKLFETVVRRCMAEGLVGGDGFAVDASLIRADANRQHSAEGAEEVDWEELATTRRSVREYLADARRDGLGRGEHDDAEVRLAVGSSCAVDWRPQGPRLLRLRHQLPDRPRPCGDRRCRGDPRPSARPKSARADHDRASREPLRSLSGAARRRHAPTARPRCSTGWCMSAGSSRTSRCSTRALASDGTFSRERLRLRPRGRRLRLPGGKDTDLRAAPW